MAISVKDIQEKVFATQASNGYNVEQVDDFLDELAEQLGAMTNDALALRGQLLKAQQTIAAFDAEKAEMAKRLPDYKEAEYFRNLEKATREALISAQRIADETVASAQTQADQLIAAANAQAEATVNNAESAAKAATDAAEQNIAALSAKAEELQQRIDDYRENFKKVIAQQMAVLQEGSALDL